MDKIKIKKETVETTKFVILLVIIYIVIALAFAYIPPLNQYHTFAIQTNSMEPIIKVDDVVVIREVDLSTLQVGDIVAFNVDITNDGKDDVVVHYIDEIIPLSDSLVFKTKPHISDSQDSWTIEEGDIIGTYQYKINGIGKILMFIQSWIGRGIILFDIVVISVLFDMFKKPKESEEEITAETIKEIEDKYLNETIEKVSNE